MSDDERMDMGGDGDLEYDPDEIKYVSFRLTLSSRVGH